MEIFELAKKRKAFAPPELRYLNPHKEALQLRLLWTNYKPLSKIKEIQQARNFYQQASKLMQGEEEKSRDVLCLTAKGLIHNPRFHPLYALRGDVYLRQGRWLKAIKNYETARLMTKFDSKLADKDMKNLYSEQLITSYRKRGDWYFDNGMLLEALSDYEQVFLHKLDDVLLASMQDKLLMLLRKLDKYEIFRRYWDEFLKNSDSARTAALLAIHAEYKIYQKQMSVARHMLLKALDLDKDNVKAQELLTIVYNTGHTLIIYALLWCMHGCHDKALMTMEKALDCNPYNPGFTLLKAIILRLSDRLDEATAWIDNVSKNCHRLLEPRDTKNSILGKLSVGEVKKEFVKQWYMIRYDKVMKCMLNDKLEYAARIIYENELTKHWIESYIMLGDIFLIRDNIDLALKSYLKCHERLGELRQLDARKTVDLTERIITILNDQAQDAVNEGHLKEAINLSDKVLQILDVHQMELHQLGVQRGRALLCKARSVFRVARKRLKENKQCCELAADSLRFVREPEDADLYRYLYGDKGIENIIDRHAPKRKLPRSLKLLMQFS